MGFLLYCKINMLFISTEVAQVLITSFWKTEKEKIDLVLMTVGWPHRMPSCSAITVHGRHHLRVNLALQIHFPFQNGGCVCPVPPTASHSPLIPPSCTSCYQTQCGVSCSNISIAAQQAIRGWVGGGGGGSWCCGALCESSIKHLKHGL